MKQLLINIFISLSLFYLLILCCNVALTGKDYNCEHYIRYRIDAIFPARAISCFLYQEINPIKKY